MRIKIGKCTDKGKKRSHNEDSIYCNEELGLFVLTDGMGGHRAGEVASKIAVDNIVADLNQSFFDGEHQIVEKYREELSEASNKLASSVWCANSKIYEAAQENSVYKGMGATVVASLISGNVMSIAYVGDSRAYLIRDSMIEQLTDDHSLVYEQLKKGLINEKEARESRYKNIITRALGAESTVEIDINEQVILDNDCVLMCSDGLYDMVEEDVIMETVLNFAKKPQKACDKLVKLANENGGLDNISVIVIRF